jgi:glyoxylase-like metal-dependent hydrolase (beta-lactamase superfamily II)
MQNNKITQLIVGPIATNCWIYQIDEKEAAIIDPGDEADKIIKTLKKINLVPRYILLTHGHFDHIIALPELAEAYPYAIIAIHSGDSEYLGPDAYKSHELSIKAAMGMASFLSALWPGSQKGLPPPARLLTEGDTVGPFTVLHLPGHTPGSAAFWDKEAGVLFTGDTLFADGYGRTDLPGGNEQELFASLRRLFAMDTKITVCPGHGGTTTIGREAG